MQVPMYSQSLNVLHLIPIATQEPEAQSATSQTEISKVIQFFQIIKHKHGFLIVDGRFSESSIGRQVGWDKHIPLMHLTISGRQKVPIGHDTASQTII